MKFWIPWEEIELMKTFLDASVLIVGWRGQAAPRIKALTILNDPKREFVSSLFVKLEVLPKAQYFKNKFRAGVLR
jgi:hypothetical protein